MRYEYEVLITIFAFLIGIPFIGTLIGPFSIGENSLTYVGESYVTPPGSFENFYNFSISDNTINFIIDGTTKSYTSPKIFFMIDDSLSISDSFYDITDGTHTIKKYQMTIVNDRTQINIQKWEKTFDVLIKYVNVTIPNQTIYVVGNITYIDRNVTTYLNKTVTVMTTPDLTAYLKKYQLYIIGIGAIGLVYYFTRVRKK